MLAAAGHREELVALLQESSGEMPGCLSYIVARDRADANAIWTTEAWATKEAHDTSLTLPAVQDAIARARPLIAGFGERFETEPVGGYRLKE
jgi:quinol monooxygenase YgiN